jgi:coniferyl-aldehyde dehydrogenase
MAIVEAVPAGAESDEKAIAELGAIVARQRGAHAAEPYPSLEQRREWLGRLAQMLMEHRRQIAEALDTDFAGHPAVAADLIEVLGPAGRAGHVAEQLEGWLAPERRAVDPALFGSGRGYVELQPKGVIGNIVPWNFPFDLSLGPLVEMLAAGNRVVIKPSEYAPACGVVLQEMVRETFDGDTVEVVLGGLELSRAFARTRWDHLLYTGSPSTGREIARAAAEQLVPVTLELGGKCPALIAADSVDAECVKQVLGTKAIKSGQMCISVDYCLVPRRHLAEFAQLAADFVRVHMPGHCGSDGATGIITARHRDRLEQLVAEARDAGADVRQLEDASADGGRRALPLTLVLDPPEEIGLMREEIFGPVLPLKPYDTLDEALDYINARERALALYVFAREQEFADEVLRRTTTGGACVNVAAAHGALATLPFGGVGGSGWGRHHGIDGVREFSNPRAVFVRGEGDLIDAFAPPYGPAEHAIVDGAFESRS